MCYKKKKEEEKKKVKKRTSSISTYTHESVGKCNRIYLDYVVVDAAAATIVVTRSPRYEKARRQTERESEFSSSILSFSLFSSSSSCSCSFYIQFLSL
jgi:hypothetical protein